MIRFLDSSRVILSRKVLLSPPMTLMRISNDTIAWFNVEAANADFEESICVEAFCVIRTPIKNFLKDVDEVNFTLADLLAAGNHDNMLLPVVVNTYDCTEIECADVMHGIDATASFCFTFESSFAKT